MPIIQHFVFNPLFFDKNTLKSHFSTILVYDRILSKRVSETKLIPFRANNFGLSRFIEDSVKILSKTMSRHDSVKGLS